MLFDCRVVRYRTKEDAGTEGPSRSDGAEGATHVGC